MTPTDTDWTQTQIGRELIEKAQEFRRTRDRDIILRVHYALRGPLQEIIAALDEIEGQTETDSIPEGEERQ